MAIQVYGSQVQAASPAGTPRVPLQQALDTRNTGDQMAIKSVLASGAKLSEDQMKVEKADHDAALATDVLDEATAYSDATRAFEKEYRDTHMGKDAATFGADLDAFHTERANESGMRFAGNPQQQELWKKQQAQLRQTSLRSSIGYMDQQDQLYRADTTKARTATLLNKVASFGSNDTGVVKAIQFYKAEVDVMNPGRDMTALYAQAELDIAITRIGLANANNDPDEGERLIVVHSKQLGKSLDDVTKQVRNVRINKDAMDHTEFIRKTMPEATRGEMFDKLYQMADGDREVYAKGRGYINQAFSDIDQAKKQSSKAFRTSFSAQWAAAGSLAEKQALLAKTAADPNVSPENQVWAAAFNTRGAKSPRFSKPSAILSLNDDIASGLFTEDELNVKYYELLEKNYLAAELKGFGGANEIRVAKYLSSMQKRLSASTYKTKSEQDKRLIPFVEDMGLWIKGVIADKHRQPTNEELDAQEKFLLEEVIVNHNHAWWNKTVPRHELDTITDDMLDPSTSERGMIARELRAVGLEPTEENIIEAYRRNLEQGN